LVDNIHLSDISDILNLNLSPWTDFYDIKEEMYEDFLCEAEYIIKDLILYNGDFYERNLKEYGIEGFINSDVWKDIWFELLVDFCENSFPIGGPNFLPLNYSDPVVIEVWTEAGNKAAKAIFESFYNNIIKKKEEKENVK